MSRIRTLAELIRELGTPIGQSAEHIHFKSPIPNEIVEIPKGKIEGGFGRVERLLGEEPSLGSVLVGEKPGTTLDEMKQGRAQLEKMRKESKDVIKNQADPLEEVPNESHIQTEIDSDPIERIRKEKEYQAEVYRKNNKLRGIAGIGLGTSQAPQIDMNPLGDIKSGYDKYKNIKDKIFGAAANQMDLTKDKSATEGIKNVLSNVGDPLNYIPGGAGLATGALQMGLESLPEKKQQTASIDSEDVDSVKDEKYKKLRSMLGQQ